jgi:tRNA (guanine37-N1)-methyltransferase
VPDVLLSGNHAAIAAWRRAEAERITKDRRPDLWSRHMADQTTRSVATPAPAP